METLNEQQINEIASELDMGFKCFFNKKTQEIVTIPNFIENPEYEQEYFEEDLLKLEINADQFIEIEKPNSRDSFNIMLGFTEQLKDNEELKEKVFHALDRKNPFSNFKFLIDNSGTYRQKWFDYKNDQLKKWVIEKLKEVSLDENK